MIGNGFYFGQVKYFAISIFAVNDRFPVSHLPKKQKILFEENGLSEKVDSGILALRDNAFR